MKYLKIYENFQSEEEITRICQRYGIRNFTINNGLVDVDGNVNLDIQILSFRGLPVLTKLPLKFGHVSGYFYCHCNQLTSLEGAPQSVGRDFNCGSNQLTSLEGGPQLVGGDFRCHNNKLTSLEGGPKSVVGNFYSRGNQLRSLEGGPQFVGGGFHCDGNPVFQVWKLIHPGCLQSARYTGDDKWDEIHMDIFNDYDCIRGEDIVIDRFNEFLRHIGKPEVDSVKGYNNI